jgi:putative glutathione S-transferase
MDLMSMYLDEKHCRRLFSSLDRVESILSKQRWLAGDVMTEADVRLFTTMLRFGMSLKNP